ncbi:MBL fold metallo-hydrolase [Niveispirillum sp. KHB5.9]|uniref:MBL fold metallo-hydrolase n=1 Tax=Niveispirillum sp. KHB5.9 TaxID=3400269 RepID=UPI003A886D20
MTRRSTRTATRYPVSDHCDGRRFFNPHVVGQEKGLGDLWRWMTGRKPIPWPDRLENQSWPRPEPVAADAISVTFIGHACFLIGIGGRWFITDPVYGNRASPFAFAGPKRVRAPGLGFDDLPGLDGILVSHNHYDHLDLASLRELDRRFQAPVVTSLGNAALIGGAGPRVVTELDWWQSHHLGGVEITYVPAQHFAARGLFDRNATLWGGFVLRANGRSLYFCGDSGYCPHFREIGERFPGIDLSLLPIGAYEPRWFMHIMHMNPEEAVQAHLDLGSRRSIGMHYGTFAGLTDEGIDDPVTALAAARAAHGLGQGDFGTLAVGRTLVL